jgi:DNA-binding NarL/FixJ family response regulator
MQLEVRPSSVGCPPVARLSVQEQRVLDLVATGSSNRAIAATLFCSAKTVESHIRSIFLKLGLLESPSTNRRVLAARLWFDAKEGWRLSSS